MYPPSLRKICDSEHLTNECKAALTRYIETGSVDTPGTATELEPITEHEAQTTTPATVLCAECGRPEDKPCQLCIKREMVIGFSNYKQSQLLLLHVTVTITYSQVLKTAFILINVVKYL